MNMSLFPAAFIFAIAIGFSSLAQAADRDWIHYNDFMKRSYLARFYAAPAATRDALVAKALVRSESPDKTVRLEIKVPTTAGVIVLRPDEEGVTDFPYSDALVQADPMLLISVPAGVKSSAGISLQPNLPLKESYGVAEAARPIDQANALIKSQAGLLSFAVPKMKRFLLRFPAGSSATVTVGDVMLTPDKAGMVSVVLDDALRKANPSIVCSQRPIALDIDS